MTCYVTHLESALDGTHLPADRPQTLHRDRPLWVRYDLDAVGRAMSKTLVAGRPSSLWRYRELLPYAEADQVVSLGETMTPLVPCPRLGARFGLTDLWIKDESRLPTGSFKSRGLAMAVTMARQFGIHRLAIPTAGNAGGAMAAYAARAGMEAFVFMPDDTPAINQYECHLAGAKTFLVQGLDHRLRPHRARRASSGWAGSTSRRSRSRTASKARKRWGWSWPSSSTGGCRT